MQMMTKQQHPITPPPELVKQWIQGWYDAEVREVGVVPHVATQAARWGADQELNECCKWLPKLPPWSADDLRKHRRPKPPSLKEQALELVDRIEKAESVWAMSELDTIRRALESLPE